MRARPRRSACRGGENCAGAPSCGGRQNCGHKKTSHKEQISRTVELIERKKQRMDRGTACLKKKQTKSRKTKHWCWGSFQKEEKEKRKIEVELIKKIN